MQACVVVPTHKYLRTSKSLDALEEVLKTRIDCLDLECQRVMNPLTRIGRLRQQALQAQAESHTNHPEKINFISFDNLKMRFRNRLE